jgi:hypothetical protein
MTHDGVGADFRLDNIYKNATTSSTSNPVVMQSNGRLLRSTSAARYKVNIKDASFDGDVLSIKPRTWFDKPSTERYAELLTRADGDEEKLRDLLAEQDIPVDVTPITGLVAEEVEAAGLKEFVIYNQETGETEGLAYERLWITLIPIIKQLRDEVAALKAAQNN